MKKKNRNIRHKAFRLYQNVWQCDGVREYEIGLYTEKDPGGGGAEYVICFS